ncbi:VOC family protein [Salinifilum aidingensis]
MHLENIVWDARDPHRLGAFWSAALDAVPITDEPDGYEARMSLGADVFLDLGFQRVGDVSTSPTRLHLDLAGGDERAERVERLLDLGAEHTGTGQGQTSRVVLADPEGNAFCVREHREAHRATGPLAALPVDSADPARDAEFWAQITEWVPCSGTAPASLRHRSGRGPALEFHHEPEPKQGKNRLHLDVRPDPGETNIVSRVLDLGARRIDEAAGLPWEVFSDPSGNEFCILAPRERS